MTDVPDHNTYDDWTPLDGDADNDIKKICDTKVSQGRIRLPAYRASPEDYAANPLPRESNFQSLVTG